MCSLPGRSYAPYASAKQRVLTTGTISSSPRSRAPIIVHPGDTLFDIARRSDVTIYDLKTANNLRSERITYARLLYLPPY